MTTLDEILELYTKENEPLTPEQENEIKSEASEHLTNYLLGDGDSRHLYNYYDCMEKIK
jgi:hypothetical protein